MSLNKINLTDRNTKYKIVILDDHGIIVGLLKQRLGDFDFVSSVVGYTEPKSFIRDIENIHFDILIIDFLMPEIRGNEIIKLCRQCSHLKNIKIIVLSTVIEYDIIKEMIELGVNGYVSKYVEEKELSKVIEFVIDERHHGEIYLSDEIKETLTKSVADNGGIHLTPRERSVLVALCEGRTVKEIAAHLSISIGSVQGYMKLIFKKFNVNRSSDLIIKAIKMRLFIP